MADDNGDKKKREQGGGVPVDNSGQAGANTQLGAGTVSANVANRVTRATRNRLNKRKSIGTQAGELIQSVGRGTLAVAEKVFPVPQDFNPANTLRSQAQEVQDVTQRLGSFSTGAVNRVGDFLGQSTATIEPQETIPLNEEATIEPTVPSETPSPDLTTELGAFQPQELDVLNDPSTVRNTTTTEQLRAIDPNDPTGTRELPLQATSSRIPGQLGASFQLEGGTVSTTSPEGAARLAQGEAVRGGKVGTINVENLVQANRAESIQRAISEGNRLGASPGDILNKINQLEQGGQPRDELQSQLDRVNEDERRGLIGGVVAEGRRNRLNTQITARQRNELAATGTSAEASQFAQQQAVRQQNADTARLSAGTQRQKSIAENQRKNAAERLDQTGQLDEIINGKSGLPGMTIGQTFQEFGVTGLIKRPDVLNKLPELLSQLQTSQSAQDVQDFVQEFGEDIGLPGLSVQQAQQLAQLQR